MTDREKAYEAARAAAEALGVEIASLNRLEAIVDAALDAWLDEPIVGPPAGPGRYQLMETYCGSLYTNLPRPSDTGDGVPAVSA